MTALLETIDKVASKALPRDTAVEIIATSFSLEKSMVEKMFGQVGRSFFIQPTEAP